MSRKNNRPDILQPTAKDVITLSKAVNDRLKGLCDLYFRLRGKVLIMPPSLNASNLKWIGMRERWFRQSDWRNTRSELLALREIAEWTHKLNCELRNQPHKPLVWRD